MPASVLGLRGASFSPGINLPRLRRAVWIAYAAAVSAALGIAIASSIAAADAEVERARSDSLRLVRALEQQISTLFGTATQYLLAARGVVEHNGGVQGIPRARLDQLLASQSFQQGAIRRVILADERGNQRDMDGTIDLDVAGTAWFQAARADRDRTVKVHLPVRSVTDGRPLIPVTARIDRADGSFDGILFLGVEAQHLAEFYKSVAIDARTTIGVVRSDGAFLMRYPDLDRVRPMSPVNRQQLHGTEGAFNSVATVDGTQRMVAYRRMEAYPFYVVLGLSTREVLRHWTRGNAERAMTAVAVILLLTMLTGMLSRRLGYEAAAMTSLAHFAKAVDRSADLVFWIGPDGRLLYANEAALKRLGYAGEKAGALSAHDICTDFAHDRWPSSWAALKQSGELRATVEARTAQGGSFPMGIAATHVVIEGQAYAFVIARDLTEQRQSDAAIAALNRTLEEKVFERTRELERANAALASFSYSISHDLRAPLRHLTGYVGILDEHIGPKADEPARNLLERISERVRHMDAMIEGLLRLAKVGRQALEFGELDISSMARQLADDLARDNPGRHVAVTIEDGMRAFGDRVLVRTALQTLLDNAWKYSSKRADAAVTFDCTFAGGESIFRIRDNGAGFDSRHATHLFGAFQRLHSQGEFPGNGIGLATAKRIVERHGGRIWAESAPGEGAAFYFTLSAAPDTSRR
jgi:PAS domain S-box-containing protein